MMNPTPITTDTTAAIQNPGTAGCTTGTAVTATGIARTTGTTRTTRAQQR